ncbi:MAG: hypothetical protein O3C60_20555, partial [Planctomycetota bacterium]|nr:hypothetical protein [Planctomycetota bacterium]
MHQAKDFRPVLPSYDNHKPQWLRLTVLMVVALTAGSSAASDSPQADRKFDFRAELQVYQAVSRGGEPIGGLLECNWHVAAGKMRLEPTEGAQL